MKLNSQFLPVKYDSSITINNNQVNLVIPPIYKWKLHRNISLYELLENEKSNEKNNKNNKNNLIDDLRYMSKYPNIDVYHYILTNKL